MKINLRSRDTFATWATITALTGAEDNWDKMLNAERYDDTNLELTMFVNGVEVNAERFLNRIDEHINNKEEEVSKMKVLTANELSSSVENVYVEELKNKVEALDDILYTLRNKYHIWE